MFRAFTVRTSPNVHADGVATTPGNGNDCADANALNTPVTVTPSTNVFTPEKPCAPIVTHPLSLTVALIHAISSCVAGPESRTLIPSVPAPVSIRRELGREDDSLSTVTNVKFCTVCAGVGVSVFVGVGVSVGVALKVGVALAVTVGVTVGVTVAVAVAVAVGVVVGVTVAVAVAVGVGVAVFVGVGVTVIVAVGVTVAVGVVPTTLENGMHIASPFGPIPTDTYPLGHGTGSKHSSSEQ